MSEHSVVQPAPSPPAYPRESYAWYVIAILFLVTVLSQMDRQLPTLLVAPIRAEFGISDTAFSILQGYAFAIVYTLAGIPLGRLVDRTHRRNLILAGLLFWSAMTVFSGLSTTYSQLFVARMGIGVGEAVLAPAAYSIIADYIAPARRGRALAVYYMSIGIGSGASLFIGGLILQALPSEGFEGPLFGHMDNWRWMFIFAGVPGFLVAGLLFTVREPARMELDVTAGQSLQPPIAEVLAYLRSHAATFSRILVYPSILAIIGYGSLAWAPALMQRRFDMPPSESGQIVGLLIAVCGTVGTLASGWLSDRWHNRGVPAARFRVTLVGQAILLPCVALWPLMPHPALSCTLLGTGLIGLAIAQTAAPPAIQEVVPNRMRGQMIAIYLLLGGLLGIGLGPTLVALITDHVFHDDLMLHWSIALSAAPMSILGLWLCWSGQRPYADTHARLAGLAPGPVLS
jgi:MFS family permease